jgi:hypothetical protein
MGIDIACAIHEQDRGWGDEDEGDAESNVSSDGDIYVGDNHSETGRDDGSDREREVESVCEDMGDDSSEDIRIHDNNSDENYQ